MTRSRDAPPIAAAVDKVADVAFAAASVVASAAYFALLVLLVVAFEQLREAGGLVWAGATLALAASAVRLGVARQLARTPGCARVRRRLYAATVGTGLGWGAFIGTPVLVLGPMNSACLMLALAGAALLTGALTSTTQHRHVFPAYTASLLGAYAVSVSIAAIRGDEGAWTLLSVGLVYGAFVNGQARRMCRDYRCGVKNELLLRARTQELVEANERALASARAKGAFLATMSHEIRTPINGVLGIAELLKMTSLQPTQREYVNAIHTSGDLLLRLVNDVLDFSKLEADQVQLEAVPFALAERLEQVLGLLRPRADEQALQLLFDVDASVPEFVRGDPTRLAQVVTNLVGNAIKFTGSGHVRLAVTTATNASAEPQLQLRVEDTGIGMDPAAIEGLFRPFTQAEASTTRRFGGTGLGLAISRRIVRAMGGEVQVHSIPGQGSTFVVSIALVPCESSLAVRSEADQLQTEPARALAKARVDATVLVVDDNSINRMVAKGMLEAAGYRVECCAGGREALHRLREPGIDLMLLDCQMPDIDGFEVLRAIRAGEAGPRDLTVVALTASAFAADRARCLEAGVDDYLSKPVRAKVLTSMVEGHLSQRAKA